jgi:hypothetical protein
MENPLGLLRNQIYRLFNPKAKSKNEIAEDAPSLQELKVRFPWADGNELELIRKEKLYLDVDFTGDQDRTHDRQQNSRF